MGDIKENKYLVLQKNEILLNEELEAEVFCTCNFWGKIYVCNLIATSYLQCMK